MKLKFVLLLITSLFLSSLTSIYAAVDEIDLEMRDTVITRGNLNLIPVFGKINVAEKKTLKIRVSFDAYIVDIKKAFGQANTAILDVEPLTTRNFSDLHNSYIDITTDNYKNIESGVICYLQVEGLVAPDTITPVKPEVISLGDTVPESKITTARIVVSGTPIFNAFNEGIEYNFPNPFGDRSTFKFRINKDSKINVRIYSPEGRKVYDLREYSDNAELNIKDAGGEKIDNPESYLFTKGTYSMILSPTPWKFASGAYFMILSTDSGVYKTNFLYTK